MVALNKTIPISSMPAGTPQGDWLIPAIAWDSGSAIYRPHKVRVDELNQSIPTSFVQAIIDANLVGYVRYSQAVVNGGPGTATPVLQAEINALIAAGGGTLHLGPGIYDCSGSQIVVDLSAISTRMQSRICIQGEGNATTIRNLSGACFAYIGSAVNVEGYFQLRDLRLQGNNVPTSVGLSLRKGAYLTIKNVTIESFDLGLDTTDIDQTLFQSCQIQFNAGGVRHNFSGGITDPNSLTYVDTKIGNNSTYGMQASNINQLTMIGGSVQYNGLIGGPSTSYGMFLSDTGSGTGGFCATGVTFEGNGGAGDFKSAQVSPGVSEANFQFTNCAFQRTLNFVTVGYGTNQVNISGTQPKCKYKFTNCAFKGLAGYVADAGRPAIVNTNPNARIEIDAMTQFWSNLEAPTDRFIYLGAVGQHTGKLVFCGSVAGENVLRGPNNSANLDWLLPPASTTLAGLGVPQTWLATQSFDLAYFNSGVVGGTAPGSVLALAATSHGAPSGDAVNVTASTINLVGATLLTADPTASLGAATKRYVDQVAQGLDAKPSVKAATTANITLSGTQTVDGISLSSGRCLVKNQTVTANNGIYDVVSSGAWTRATDADAWTEFPGSYVWVEQGTVNGDTGWVCTVDAGGTLGSTSVTFTQFAGAGSYTAGTGLVLAGTQFSIDGSVVARLGSSNIFTANQFINANLLVGAATTNISTAPMVVHVAVDKNLFVGGNFNLADGFSIGSINDANTLLKGIEFRASAILLSANSSVSGTFGASGLTTISANAAAASTEVGGLLKVVGADNNSSVIQVDSFGVAGSQFSTLFFRQAAGTAAVPLQTQSGAIVGLFGGKGYTNAGTYSIPSGQVRFTTTENYTATAQGQKVGIVTTPTGTTAGAVTAEFFASSGVGLGGASDPGAGHLAVNGAVMPKSYTVATLPSGTAGMIVFCSNCRMFNGAGVQEGAGAGTGGMVSYNGSAWKIAGTNVTAIA